jgi:mono/diheme cytochrome c family protein
MFRVLRIILVVVLVAIVGFSLFVAARQNASFADMPLPPIAANADPAVIAHGEYIVRTVGDCVGCHAATDRTEDVMRGDTTLPLSGGHTWKIPPGTFYARNITPDTETGLGKVSDGQIARALRYGVGHDGRVLLPFMEMQGLADDDLAAVVSYLRSMPPVKNAVPLHEYSFPLGKIVKATLFASPKGPKEPPPKLAPTGLSVERGRYLADSVALCWGCHTDRSMKTGELLNPKFSGGKNHPDPFDKSRVWNPPNLTRGKGGRLALFDEEAFVKRMRAGRALPGSPMPWQNLARWTEDDVRSVYRFLASLDPVDNDVGAPLVQASK